MNRMQGKVLPMVLALLSALALGAFLVWFFSCPCERIPGGYLRGDEVAEPVTDWSFANEVPLCQIQVQAGWLPHSINLNCMASQGELYLSCSGCAGKRWSGAAVESSEARLRAGTSVYPVSVRRELDPGTLDRAWLARAVKVGAPTDTPRPSHWWSFRVISR
jgi:hypothetical protein